MPVGFFAVCGDIMAKMCKTAGYIPLTAWYDGLIMKPYDALYHGDV